MKKRLVYCKGCGKPVDGQWYPQIEKYEADVLSKRGEGR